MFCGRCGARIESPDALFCRSCGAPVEPDEPVERSAQQAGARALTGAPMRVASPPARGSDVLAEGLVRYRGRGRKKRVTTDHVSLHIKPNEFVAIIGGSGSGKSTLLNELNGSEPADEGRVYLDGVDLYANYEVLREQIGYVPQADIVYDNLTLRDMLGFAADLRMPPETPPEVRQKRVQDVIDKLKLTEVANNLIGKMSGGQKKRASIGVELLADPKLLFLDEPTSGLDPSTERHMMELCAEMAHEGRTVVLVTHTTTNLHLCDKVVILGPGGKLCYFGDPDAAPAFFGEPSFLTVYEKIETDPEGFVTRFARVRSDLDPSTLVPKVTVPLQSAPKAPAENQLRTLIKRYVKLIVNDRSRLALLILQAPILAALISYVTGDGCFEIYENTKSCLFALSCAAFWVGILDSIQEICKERAIFLREYEGGLSIRSYVVSKVIVLGSLCLLQSLLITVVFCYMVPAAVQPYASYEFAFIRPLQLFASITFTTLSAMCLGLLVSAMFTNADRAIAMAPVLIMPQILFSGIVVELKGVIEIISKFIFCRWGMQAMGASADLATRKLSVYGETITYNSTTITLSEGMGFPRPENDEWMFRPLMENMFASWSVLIVSSAICVAVCLGLLYIKTRKKK